MDSTSSSSLLHLNSKSIHHTNDHNHPNHLSIDASHHVFNSSHHHHLSDFLAHSQPSKTHQLPFPLPNFLIDPQDGQFTPYFDRSPASSPGQEYDDPFDFSHHNSQPPSPMIPLTPLRSRATSIALKKLIDIQAQRLLDISAAWKKKYPAEEVEDKDFDSGSSDDQNRAEVVQQVEEPVLQSQDPPQPILCKTPQDPFPIIRHRGSLSRRSATSLASFVERLSLNDHHGNQRNPQKIDVEQWKREVEESKLRLETIKKWVSSVPPPVQHDDMFQSGTPLPIRAKSYDF